MILLSEQSISYMNTKVADELYELSNNHYDDFIDLLVALNKTSLDSRQLEILIKINYFIEFGEINQLMHYAKAFKVNYEKKQYSKAKISETPFTEEEIAKFAGKETEKMYTKVNSYELLKYYAKTHTDFPKISIWELVKFQNENLGYIEVVDKQYDKQVVILEVDSKYSPRVRGYGLATGKTFEFRVLKNRFKNKKFKKDDVIKCYAAKHRPKQKFVSEGKYEPIPGTEELWVYTYDIVYNAPKGV